MKYGWSLDNQKWKQLQDAVKHYDWNRVYLGSDYAPQVPTRCGVYLICASPKMIPIDGKVMTYLYNAIYAGHSLDLRRRFRDHVRGYRDVVHAESIFRRLEFWYSEFERRNLIEIEQLLVDTLGPTANGKNVKARIGEPIPAGRMIGV